MDSSPFNIHKELWIKRYEPEVGVKTECNVIVWCHVSIEKNLSIYLFYLFKGNRGNKQ